MPSLIMSITSALISFCSLISSILIFRMNVRASARPVLVFEYKPGDGWHLKNIGQGPALNILVALHQPEEWFHPVRIPPISKDGSIALTWCLHDNVHGLGALYEDVNAERYTSTCGNDLSTTRRGFAFGPWRESEIGKLWANGQIVPPLLPSASGNGRSK